MQVSVSRRRATSIVKSRAVAGGSLPRGLATCRRADRHPRSAPRSSRSPHVRSRPAAAGRAATAARLPRQEATSASTTGQWLRACSRRGPSTATTMAAANGRAGTRIIRVFRVKSMLHVAAVQLFLFVDIRLHAGRRQRGPDGRYRRVLREPHGPRKAARPLPASPATSPCPAGRCGGTGPRSASSRSPLRRPPRQS